MAGVRAALPVDAQLGHDTGQPANPVTRKCLLAGPGERPRGGRQQPSPVGADGREVVAQVQDGGNPETLVGPGSRPAGNHIGDQRFGARNLLVDLLGLVQRRHRVRRGSDGTQGGARSVEETRQPLGVPRVVRIRTAPLPGEDQSFALPIQGLGRPARQHQVVRGVEELVHPQLSRGRTGFAHGGPLATAAAALLPR